MKHISVMLKPASSLCNLRCRYCFYAEVSDSREIRSFGVMERDTAAKIVENIFSRLDSGDEVNLAFQGGEPTLAGLGFFRFFVSEVERVRGKVKVSYALQTNGTLLDEEWCAFFKEHGFLIGLSLDAMQAIHDQNRVDASGKGTYGRVMAAFRARPTGALRLCESCPYTSVCGGGCPRMRREVCGAPDAGSCGYRQFLQNTLSVMQRFAFRERRERTGAN